MMAVHAVLGRFDSGSDRGSERGLVFLGSGTFGSWCRYSGQFDAGITDLEMREANCRVCGCSAMMKSV